jgi:hypothetical protein
MSSFLARLISSSQSQSQADPTQPSPTQDPEEKSSSSEEEGLIYQRGAAPFRGDFPMTIPGGRGVNTNAPKIYSSSPSVRHRSKDFSRTNPNPNPVLGGSTRAHFNYLQNSRQYFIFPQLESHIRRKAVNDLRDIWERCVFCGDTEGAMMILHELPRVDRIDMNILEILIEV